MIKYKITKQNWNSNIVMLDCALTLLENELSDIPKNIRNNYTKNAMLESIKKFIENGFFEWAIDNDSLVGVSAFYVDKNVAHLGKRGYIAKKFRCSYQHQTLFLHEQLECAKQSKNILFACQTFNEGQGDIVRAIKRILNGKSLFLGKSNIETFPVYLKNNTMFLEGYYNIYNVPQQVLVYNYHNLSNHIIETKINEFA